LPIVEYQSKDYFDLINVIICISMYLDNYSLRMVGSICNSFLPDGP